MIRKRRAKKKDLPMLIEYKLLTILPYIKDNQEKLKAISYVNDFITKNYLEFKVLYSLFKPIGVYLILNKELDTLYITKKNQNKGIGSKILKKELTNIDKIKVQKENKQAIKFYQKNGFTKKEIHEKYIILRKG